MNILPLLGEIGTAHNFDGKSLFSSSVDGFGIEEESAAMENPGNDENEKRRSRKSKGEKEKKKRNKDNADDNIDDQKDNKSTRLIYIFI